MNPNFSLTNTEFFGNSYDFKMYTSSNNDFYFQYKKETDFSKLGDFFAQMNIEKLLDIELGNASINSIVVFSNKIPSQKFKLEKESIKGVLLYVKNGDICVLG